ncbi:MAG: selenium metabolism-associated LysR family transcriptional regulator [Candidatus Velthaea sp.]
MLTEAGFFVHRRAGELLGNVAALERDVREYADARTGRLHLGATLTIGSYGLPTALAEFKRTFPDLDVTVKVSDTATMLTYVRNGDVNLALIEGPVADEDTLTVIPYHDDELTLVVPHSGHRLSGASSIGIEELRGEPFVIREEGRGTEHVAGAVLAAAGIVRNVVLELPTGGAVARAVAAGLGVAILSPLIVAPLIADKQLHAVTIEAVALRRSFQVVYRREHTLSPAARSFMRQMTR